MSSLWRVPEEVTTTETSVDEAVGAVRVPESALVQHCTVVVVAVARRVVVTVIRREHHAVVVAE